jgi:hypothetical protein
MLFLRIAPLRPLHLPALGALIDHSEITDVLTPIRVQTGWDCGFRASAHAD